MPKPRRKSGDGVGTPNPPCRGRRISPEEQAERDERKRVLAERTELRRREILLMEALAPTVGMPDDPFTRHERLMPWDARTSQGVLLAEVKRPNGTLVRVVRRTYDGEAGGVPRERYIGVYTLFRGSGAALRRSRGSALISREEATAVHDALGRELADWPKEAANAECSNE